MGFGAGWLLANVFDASLLVTAVVAVVGALLAWVLVRLAATLVFFVVGALVGLLVGARLFRLLEGGDGNLLLAVVFIPAIGIAGGWLAEKTREAFVAWGTSIGGAALVLAGLGRARQRAGLAARPERDLAGRGRGGGVGRPVGRSSGSARRPSGPTTRAEPARSVPRLRRPRSQDTPRVRRCAESGPVDPESAKCS